MQSQQKRNHLEFCLNSTLKFAAQYKLNRHINSCRVVRGVMENQRTFEYLNEETREIIKNFFENGVSISVIARSFGVHRTTVWRVIKGKTEYRTKRGGRKWKTSKVEDDYMTITIKKNYNRPTTTIKKYNFPQHSRWLIRNRNSESGFRLHSPTITPTWLQIKRKNVINLLWKWLDVRFVIGEVFSSPTKR